MAAAAPVTSACATSEGEEMNLESPIANEEGVAMGYTLAEMDAAARTLRQLWQVVERENRARRAHRARRKL